MMDPPQIDQTIFNHFLQYIFILITINPKQNENAT